MKTAILLAALAAGGLGAGQAAAADLSAGEERYGVNCVNCHGRTGRGMASFPSIAGRDAEFITSRLKSYRARETVGPNSALMFSLADELSDEDIANLSAFIAETFR